MYAWKQTVISVGVRIMGYGAENVTVTGGGPEHTTPRPEISHGGKMSHHPDRS